jgi:protein-L-isoaspartate(D-aspartate) O-methyltransferase
MRSKAVYPNAAFERLQGIGLTSQRMRDRMVERQVALGLEDKRVIEAIRATPRHCFVDEALASRAYEDTALPIGFGQTISQPSSVATMTQALLRHHKPKKVLEIGTGSGYQTAILAQLVPQLWTTERICELQQRAKTVLTRLELKNVHYRCDPTELGWAKAGKFDAILSAAAPEEIPASLVAQLAMGGRLIMPVGGTSQELIVMDKTPKGLIKHSLGGVLFVPLIEQDSE